MDEGMKRRMPSQNIGTGDLQRKLKNSKITWLCCNIAWILEELTLEETINFYCASFEDGVLSCGQKTNFDAIRTTLMGTTITYPSCFQSQINRADSLASFVI
ncbi:hypothetical protein N7541_000124 [Penicillium brevicompactum]|uniref:Uncharacterized protein n=1 Tax=Penicillium brevicompactum TaxID=5074 RepID=A0A9W9RTJ0_PENBR|nr:hypothetical protein N7541_000124 [Penicillium brevicompactum]